MAKRLRYLRSFGWFLSETKGVGGKLAMLRMKLTQRTGSGPHEPVAIPMRALGQHSLWVRPGTTDLLMGVLDYHLGCHLPPPEVRDDDLKQIVELGANSGGALAGLAAHYPNARIVAVEPDPENASIATRNAEAFGERCTVVTCAVWDTATTLTIDGTGATGFVVRPVDDNDPPEMPRVAACTVDQLLAEHMPDGDIDFLLVTIEGTEPRILGAGGDWVKRVRSIRAEFQPQLGQTPTMMSNMLRELGFETRSVPPGSLADSSAQATPPERRWVYGIRSSASTPAPERAPAG